MTFDFTSARLKHSSWKLRLRNFLDGKGGLSTAEAVSHRDCDLGKWLYSEGLSKYSSMREMSELARDHEELHRTVKSVVDLKRAGKTKEAEAAFRSVEPLSNRIVQLLTDLEAKVDHV